MEKTLAKKVANLVMRCVIYLLYDELYYDIHMEDRRRKPPKESGT